MTRTAHGLQLVGSSLRIATATRVGGNTRVTTREAELTAATTARNGNDAPYHTALPTNVVLSRSWQMPETNDQQLRQMVQLRLEADLPLPLDEFRWNYQTSQAADGHVTVRAHAVRRSQLDRLTHDLASAGFDADLITTEGEALAALYRLGLHAATPPPYDALVLADADAWLLAHFEDGQLASARRLCIASEDLDGAVRQLQQVLQRSGPRGPLQRLLWCSTTPDDDTRSHMSAAFGLRVEPLAAPGDLRDENDEPLCAMKLAHFGPAIGLALAGLEPADAVWPLVASQSAADTKPRDWQARIAARPLLWTGLAAISLLLALGVHVGALQWEANRMQTLLDDLGPEGNPMAPLQDRVIAMQRLERFRIDILRLVTNIAAPVPNGIILTNIQISRERGLLLKGKSPSPQAAYQLADALRECPRFDRVNPESIGGGEFVIRADIVDLQPLPALNGGPQWR
jgi:hypothetical protein